jgi:translation initiation factor 4E
MATTTSPLPTPAARASEAALSAAIAENGGDAGADAPADKPADAPGAEDVQEVEINMESQADQIRTVFSDPTNFNVKVRPPVV